MFLLLLFFWWVSLFIPDFFVIFLAGGVSMCACMHVRMMCSPLILAGASSLVTISADPSCLPNPSLGGVVLLALLSAGGTQLTLQPPPQKSLPGGGDTIAVSTCESPPAL